MAALGWLLNLDFAATAGIEADVLGDICLSGTDARIAALASTDARITALSATQALDSALGGTDARTIKLKGVLTSC